MAKTRPTAKTKAAAVKAKAAAAKAAAAPSEPLPEHYDITISEFNGERRISAVWQPEAMGRDQEVLQTTYDKLNARQRKAYDEFVAAMDEAF